MAQVVIAAATSHAYALRNPEDWDELRLGNQKMYERRYGSLPETQPEVAQETDEDNQYRYAKVRRAHDALRDSLASAQLDAVVVLGDDQNEEFTEETFLPQLAIYTGSEFTTRAGTVYRCNQDLAQHIYTTSVDADFDMTTLGSVPDGVLKAHAFGPVLERLEPAADIPVVPLYIEAIHLPALSPRRCYEFGKVLAKAIESWTGGERVAVIASGGVSHRTQSYPYKHAPDAIHGSIDHDYDRQLLALMVEGRGEELARLSNRELLDHGDPELHAWISLLGMVGSARANVLAYEPFYRAIMGMGVVAWDVAATPAA